MPATNCPPGVWTEIADAPVRFFGRNRTPSAPLWLAFVASEPSGAEPDPASEHTLLDQTAPTVRTTRLAALGVKAFARPLGPRAVTLEWSEDL